MLVKRKVKAGNHVLPLLTTRSAQARPEPERADPPGLPDRADASQDDALFAEADALLLAAHADKTLDDEVSADELAAVNHIITQPKGDEEDE